MEEKQAKKLAATLAELVVWYGEEDHGSYCKRLGRAERLLRRIAPDVLAAEKVKVQANYD